MEFEGHIKFENSFLTDDCFCGFMFELESTPLDEHPPEVL
jgi:hypothetical protein